MNREIEIAKLLAKVKHQVELVPPLDKKMLSRIIDAIDSGFLALKLQIVVTEEGQRLMDTELEDFWE